MKAHSAGLETLRQTAYLPLTRTRQVMTTMAKMMNPLRFIQQVRAEVSKVVWPTRRETLLTTGMVFVMAALTAIFFAIVDLIIRFGLQTLLNFFG